MTITKTRVKKTIIPRVKVQKPAKDGVLDYNQTSQALKRILASAQEELELIRQMKAEAERYRQDSLKKDDSEGRWPILNARLMEHREIEEVVRQASEEIQKILANIRITRIGVQEELAKQRDIVETDRLNGIFASIKEAFQKPSPKNIEKRFEAVDY